VSAALVPVGKQVILLKLYRANLNQWDQSIAVRYRSELVRVAIRVGVVLLIFLLVLVLAELWRRMIFRYVREGRRRYQLLLVRKLLLWFVIAVLLVFTLSTQLTSIATFAGLLTAGVAVALQSVILSMVGYFFLIGRYGLTGGDRVEVNGTVGEVIE